MGDSLSVLEGKTETAAPAQGDSLAQLEASAGPNTNGSQPGKPYAPSAGKWYSGLDDVANAAIDAVKGAVNTVRHPIDAAKGIAALPGQAAQVPAAIHDINQSADPTGTYLDVAQKTSAQGAGQALVALGTEGLGKAAPTIAKGAKAVGRQVIEQAPEIGASAGAGIGASVAGSPGAMVGTVAGRALGKAVRSKLTAETPTFPSYDGATATEYAGESAKGRALPEAPKIKAITGTQQDLPLVMGEDMAPGTTPKSVHPDAAEFEKTFGLPIDNYVDKAGKLNTPDFLNDIVKPKTQSPNDVINRTFGSDGVDLVKKLNGGKYLDKWESNDPARANASVSGGSGAATLEKTSEVPARGYLKKVGADEGSILNGVGRTPGEHADSVNYHREQIRAGTSTPSELHVDQDGNVIGADGRHRALAAIQEHGPDAKIKVRVVQHRFQGVE